MKAIEVKGGNGPASALYIADVPTPEPKDHQALVKVYAFGVNRMDILQRQIAYPLPPGAPHILGVEFSGVIEKVGAGASTAANGTSKPGFAVGDAVFGLVPGGAYAEFAVCDFLTLAKIPPGISFTEAAGICENWFTAVQTLDFVGEFKKRDKVMVHAGASGIGVAVIQLAQTLGCRRVFATVGSDEKKKFVSSLALKGALPDEVVPINYRTEDFAEVVKKYDPNGIQVIVDPIGGSYLEKNIDVLGTDGRLVAMGLLGGPTGTLSMQQLIYKRLQLKGTTLRSRSPEYQSKLRDFVVDHLVPKFANGTLKVIIDRVFPWEEISQAHEYMEANKNSGKIIVTVVKQPFNTSG